VLADGGCPGGAIYLYGYVVEMVLKAASYRMLGVGANDPLEATRPIVEEWIAEYVLRNKKKKVRPHDLDAWARWLVYSRANLHGAAYPHPFSLDLGSNTAVVLQYWEPSMRYHQLPCSPADEADVRAAAQWFLNEHPNM